MQTFAIDIPEPALDDLRRRIRSTRWPEGVVDSGGIAVEEMQRLLAYWADDFDWRARQRELNAYPQFTMDVDGQSLHFVRTGSSGATPILLLHGWPGSFIELLGVADRLRTQFDVIVPSVPGYGFSSIPRDAGWSNQRVADLFATFMTRLGLERFIVHGGDIGAGIGSWLAVRHPQRVIALHLNYIPGSYVPPPGAEVTDEEQAFLDAARDWADSSYAYGHLQRTTPLTGAYGLSDSPAGLAAWIAEKFQLWADPASDISRDVLLTNIAIYWHTNTIASSIRYYYESVRTPLALTQRIAVPTYIARFPLEMPFPPRSWVDRGYDVRRWTDMPRGGHFAALEAPDLLAADILRACENITNQNPVILSRKDGEGPRPERSTASDGILR